MEQLILGGGGWWKWSSGSPSGGTWWFWYSNNKVQISIIMTSKIKVDNINKVSDDSNIIKKCGTTITLGASGDSIALASGASQTGFGRTGTVDWQTAIKTSDFTAVSGEGYFVNTTGGAFTMTSSSRYQCWRNCFC